MAAVLRYLCAVLALAVAYYLTGRLGLLLAVPPGFATAVWPPSGIALAGLLLYGNRLWPGVWLGSFAVNLATSFDATGTHSVVLSLLLAASIGLGAALQAVVGAVLVRRYLHGPIPLDRDADVVRFLVLGGPVSCLLGASLGVTLLWQGGLIPGTSYFFSWWTWWVGDTVGVLVVTPLALVAAGQPRAVWRPRRFTVGVPLVVALGVVVGVFILARNAERDRVQLEFEQQAARLARMVGRTHSDTLDVLHSLQTFHNSAPKIDRVTFAALARPMLARYPFLTVLSWEAVVTAERRADFERSLHPIVERGADGQLVPAGRHQRHIAVTYLEPLEANRAALGFDLTSDPLRRVALDRAAHTGQPCATAPLSLVQVPGRPAVLLFLPMHTPGASAQLCGYYSAGILVDDLVAAALKEAERRGLVLRIDDADADETRRTLYGEKRTETVPEGMTWAGTLDVAGRRWTVQCWPTLDYLAARQTWSAWLVLAGGVLFASLLGGFLLVLTGRTAHIEHQVEERTAEIESANQLLQKEIADRIGSARALQESEQRLKLSLDNSKLGLWDWDVASGAVILDDNWAAILGYDPGELPNHIDTWTATLHPDDWQHVLEVLQRHLLSDDELYDVSYRARKKNGDWTWINARGRVQQRSPEGVALRMMGTIRDISEQKQTEETLRRAKELAEAATQARGEFLANVSHEIRTPLNGILGLTDLVLASALTAEQQGQLELVRQSGDALLAILNDLLDFSKIDAGKLDLDESAFRLRERLDEVMKVLAVRAEAKGLLLRCDVAATVPDALWGDAGRLGQILFNLVGNAIKFTERGSIVVACSDDKVTRWPGDKVTEGGSPTSLTLSPGHLVTLSFSVRDTGIGIAADRLSAIFEPFVQADGSTTRQYGGTGLGLAIVARLVERMGGRIWVESDVGAGSTFHFTTCWRVVDEKEVPRGTTAPPRPARSLRILLAEDNVVNQMVTVHLLRAEGHQVTVAANGKEALAVLARAPFDLALMDVQMPELDGLQTTAALRAREHPGSRLPVIALTAHAMKGDRDRCLAAGMDGYVSKPIRPEELWRAIAELVPVSAGAPSPGVLDRATLLERLGGSRQLLRDIAGVFRTEGPRALEAIRAAVESRNAERLARDAHYLKGMLGNLSAARAAEVALRLEVQGRAANLTEVEPACRLLDEEVGRVLTALEELVAEESGR